MTDRQQTDGRRHIIGYIYYYYYLHNVKLFNLPKLPSRAASVKLALSTKPSIFTLQHSMQCTLLLNSLYHQRYSQYARMQVDQSTAI